MQEKHLKIRIEQCLAIAKASNCPRRKFGAIILEPERNLILMDSYNGGPRGGGKLCNGDYCVRDGLSESDIEIVDSPLKRRLEIFLHNKMIDHVGYQFSYTEVLPTAEDKKKSILEKNQPIKSGTMMEKGCHHAELNAICNAAAQGIRISGSWLLITGEPCLMCAKAIHHAGIVKVVLIKGGYAGENGIQYLLDNRIEIQEVDGPTDPRLELI